MTPTDIIVSRAAARRRTRTGLVERTCAVADLKLGDRVVWLDGSRAIGLLEDADDGTGHVICHYVDHQMRPLLPCSRYRPDGMVQVLELTPDAPAEVAA
jgi:hypothetical protein